MGVEIFPIVEGRENSDDIPQEFWHVEWKWLTNCVDALEQLAQQLKLTPLDDFQSYSRGEAVEELSEEEVEEVEAGATFENGWFVSEEGYKLWTLERQWYSADDGLKTTRGLIQQLQNHPDSIKDSNYDEDDLDGFIYVLQELEKVLIEAQHAGKRFFLAGSA